MLNAYSIYRFLIEDEQPEFPGSPDELIPVDDIKAEVERYAAEPFNVRGGGPTDLYTRLLRTLNDRPRKKVANNTYVIRNADNLAVRFHQTDVVTAYPDGRVVVNSGGWKHGTGGHGYNPGWSGEPGTTTLARINDWLCSGWSIYKLNGEWYWYNSNQAPHWTSDTKYPYTDGDTIQPAGDLKLQADPVYVKRRPRKV